MRSLVFALAIAIFAVAYIDVSDTIGKEELTKEVWKGELRDGTEITREDLSRILRDHKKWIQTSESRVRRADLSGADLSKADLRGVNLKKADLSEANLEKANMSQAYLAGANLSKAVLLGADLSQAILEKADLREANLEKANMSQAYLGEN